MTNNTIRELLEHVTQTGRVPDPKTVRAAVTKYASVAERREIERKVRITAAKIVGALDSNLPANAAQLAEETGEALAEYTDAGASQVEMPDRWTTATHDERVTPTGTGYGAQRIAEALSNAPHGEVSTREVEKLVAELGPDVDADAFRADIADLISDAQRVHRTGEQAQARQLVRQAASELGGLLREPEPVERHADLDGEDLARALANDVKSY